MSNLFAMNIYIFIFLVHIVDNKERFFIKRTDNGKKVEFTLNVTTVGGGNFYNMLKANKTINQNMTFEETTYDCFININAPPYQIGEALVIYPIGQIIGNQNGLIIFIENSYPVQTINEKIGNIDVNNQPEFYLVFDSTSLINVEFQLIEEKNETPKKRKKLSDWKIVKILKIIKALKRYRILKRLKKLKALKN